MKQFKVTYEDATTFVGNPLKREWNNIDVTKKIIKLEYVLEDRVITLEGYRQYNHLIEYVAFAQKGINKIMLMGRTFDMTEILVIDLKTKQIYKKETPIYKEYGQQILAGWQKGMMMTPKMTMRKFKK